MASPFFSSYWNQPSESRYSPSSTPLKRKPETASPKVISIPVHFVGSENNSGLNRSGSALKIQKVFRGFLLRKSVNKIVIFKNQVEEIERRIAQNGTVELIRKDSKERLRINETLMALLFKLDSVRGIDSGVRELRKGVIRKAIALQERVDASLVMLPPDSIMSDAGQIVLHHPIRGDEMPIQNSPPADEMPTENVVDSIKSEIIMEDHPICDDIENQVESMDVLNDDQEEGSCVIKEIVEECNAMNSKTQMSEEAGEKKSNEELQTQMIRMMSELVEKNEMQTRMINSLTHRVGQLEKAFLCDKLGRTNKKKKRQHDAAADGKQQ